VKEKMIRDNGLTVYNFNYAVNLDAPLVSVFRFNGKDWKFIRNAKRWDAISICQLEQMCGDEDLQIFPIGMIPGQIWNLLHRLENNIKN
jgi:hypothetical protein